MKENHRHGEAFKKKQTQKKHNDFKSLVQFIPFHSELGYHKLFHVLLLRFLLGFCLFAHFDLLSEEPQLGTVHREPTTPLK